jgi:HPt (histidine-containing phosphotransfer) domain-containing protein
MHMTDSEPIDLPTVLQRTELDHISFLLLLDQSLPHLARRMSALKDAIRLGNNDRAAAEAHAIKGSAASLGMDMVREQALRVELAARSGKRDHIDDEFQLLGEKVAVADRYGRRLIAEAPIGSNGPE